ncbi:hypothetical protein GGX14DRAFT_404662 [Mycena pura]|uniref:Uncharacterized protein n=1 Tax=Mycena pura TaxID=153505 RepID=A0AAD6UTV1_9AGAR|nr:hypothetical protein GGX14DRAFT_404662 [Mycena pura]
MRRSQVRAAACVRRACVGRACVGRGGEQTAGWRAEGARRAEGAGCKHTRARGGGVACKSLSKRQEHARDLEARGEGRIRQRKLQRALPKQDPRSLSPAPRMPAGHVARLRGHPVQWQTRVSAVGSRGGVQRVATCTWRGWRADGRRAEGGSDVQRVAVACRGRQWRTEGGGGTAACREQRQRVRVAAYRHAHGDGDVHTPSAERAPVVGCRGGGRRAGARGHAKARHVEYGERAKGAGDVCRRRLWRSDGSCGRHGRHADGGRGSGGVQRAPVTCRGWGW